MTPIETRKRRVTPAEDRFWPKVQVTQGCWLWIGGRDMHGYGHFYFGPDDGQGGSHRFSWELRNGPVPAGMHLDHLCRVRHCVRPDHMEVVSNRENVLRGVGPSAENARKTHCKRDHEFTPENTGRNKAGNRYCRECERAKWTRTAERRKAVRQALRSGLSA